MSGTHSRLDDALRDRAARYVLETLESGEIRTYEAHLEICPACLGEVAGLRSLFGNLATAVVPVEPPPALKGRLFEEVRRDPYHLTPAAGQTWQESGVAGVTFCTLTADAAANRHTLLVRMRAGASYPVHAHLQAEECYVIEGDLRDRSILMNRGDFIRFEAGTHHGPITTEQGCLLLITSSMGDEILPA
jgi:anti-sigma factor ChrR (cupin superfamily)